ncbi:type I-E CRISPR-associated protein Cas5/CasD [Endozoicomonas sp. ONNA2]|uniref:type I-E CRISPR-associated protein Cas5/CasD n=1 Tax=Endozoicomonas sp. ONNA2 TaxID=2828741 RepID=UPI002149762B|nr:type I-E CRISPR-associated protein Cas5/CasD [Endozoicomonas sp. ONNA2]
MRGHLIVKLAGPLQSWGQHSFEGLRTSARWPGRSALLGLLGACLGIDRQDREGLRALADSVAFAVRCDRGEHEPQKMTDYHTVKNARVDYQGLKSHETIQTWREYWQDAKYTVAVWSQPKAVVTLDRLHQALCKPVYTPVLGRRSCPLACPLVQSLFAKAVVTAPDALSALAAVAPFAGMVYSEEGSGKQRELRLRDVPLVDRPRQFAARRVFVQQLEQPETKPETEAGDHHVSG